MRQRRARRIPYLGVHLERQHDLGRAVPPRRDVFGHEPSLGARGLRGAHGPREAEVAHLEVAVRVQQQVRRLEVAVDDLVGVHVVAGTDELDHEEAGFGLGEASSSTEHVREGAVVAELEGHVDVVFILEAVLEADNVRVLERLVDLDFCIKLRAGARRLRTIAGRRKERDALWFWLSYF